MTTYLYNQLLDPNLYDKFAANFIDMLLEPEVDTASEELLNTLKQDMMATDDIDSITELISHNSQEKILSSGTLSPQFISYTDKHHKFNLDLEENIPTKSKNIYNFLSAGKALSMIKTSQCIFFATMQPIKDGFPATGKDVNDDSPWGIFVIGSSLRGNCFVNFHQIIRNSDEVCFNLIHQKIIREKEYDYPFSRFFHINNYTEMNNIINQIPKLMIQSNISEQECVINFATTLKALKYFGYQN